MKVHELITQLQALPRSSTVYVSSFDGQTGEPILLAVEGVDPAESPEYGTAVIIEMEG